MSFVKYILSKHPLLKKEMRMAGLPIDPDGFVKKSLKKAIFMGFIIAAGLFFMLSKDNPTFFKPIVGGILVGYFSFAFSFRKLQVKIQKKGKQIDRDVLFAGRFLLVKLNSGKPLINALEEASEGFGYATTYFQKIMRDIHLGTPLEKALDRATEYCPSNSLKKILFQITNALKIGVDVTDFLQAVLDEISDEQLNEIVRYGKKLSSLTMFYMLGAIIVPSLGMTLFVVVAGMININLDVMAFAMIIFGLGILQFIFITLFRSARPNIDL
jgi:pilus assembly protein TadC